MNDLKKLMEEHAVYLDGYTMDFWQADDDGIINIGNQDAIIRALRDGIARIEMLEGLVIQYRDDLLHPITNQDSIDRRLVSIATALSVKGAE